MNEWMNFIKSNPPRTQLRPNTKIHPTESTLPVTGNQSMVAFAGLQPSFSCPCSTQMLWYSDEAGRLQTKWCYTTTGIARKIAWFIIKDNLTPNSSTASKSNQQTRTNIFHNNQLIHTVTGQQARRTWTSRLTSSAHINELQLPRSAHVRTGQ